jgi:hypothetical protein
VFVFMGLPSALLGAFPLWLGWRRGRPLFGLIALAAAVAIGWTAVVLAGSFTRDPFARIVAGAAGGLLSALTWSVALLRVERRGRS